MTIDDVAREVGVSAMTVSRVLNKVPGASEATRHAVLEAVRRLNYVPHAGARSVAAGRRAHVGLLYAVPTGSYHSAFLLGALDAARKAELFLLVEACSIDTSDHLRDAVRRLASSGVGGIVLPPPICEMEAVLNEIGKIDLPLVTVGAPPHPGYFNVRINDWAGAAEITNYLIGLGHRRIAHISGPAHEFAAVERKRGFELAMNEAGLQIEDGFILHGDFTYKSGIEAADVLLSRTDRPTAIFAANDEMAAAAVNIAHYKGLKVPDDVSIAGFDDTSIAVNSWPEITTIRQPIEAMARTAVLSLADIMRSDTRQSDLHCGERILECELVIRRSAEELVTP